MRYPASEMLEIIQIVEQSHLPAKWMLDRLGIPRTTFYRWYDRYQTGGPEALENRSPKPSHVWTALPTKSGIGSLSWRWMNLSCHRANWRYASPIRMNILYQNHQFTGCLRLWI